MNRDAYAVLSHAGSLSRYFEVKDGYTFVLFTEPYKCNYAGYQGSISKLVNSPNFLKKSCYQKVPAKLISDIHKKTGTFNNINDICTKTIRKKCEFCKELNKLVSSTNVNVKNESAFINIQTGLNNNFSENHNPGTLYQLWGIKSGQYNYQKILREIGIMFIEDIEKLQNLDNEFFDNINESEILKSFILLKKKKLDIVPWEDIVTQRENLLYFPNLTYMLFKYYSCLLCDNLDLKEYQLDFLMHYLQLLSPYEINRESHDQKVRYLLQSTKYNFSYSTGQLICPPGGCPINDCENKLFNSYTKDKIISEKFKSYFELNPLHLPPGIFTESKYKSLKSIDHRNREYYDICRENKINNDITFYKELSLIADWKIIKNRKSNIGYYFKLNKDLYYKKKGKIINGSLIMNEQDNKISSTKNYFGRGTIGIPYNSYNNRTISKVLDEFTEKENNDFYVTVYGSKAQYDVNYRRMQDMKLNFSPVLQLEGQEDEFTKTGIYKLPNSHINDFYKFTKEVYEDKGISNQRGVGDKIKSSLIPIELKDGSVMTLKDVVRLTFSGSLDLDLPKKTVSGSIWNVSNRKYTREPIMRLSDIQESYPPGIYFVSGCRVESNDNSDAVSNIYSYITGKPKPTPTLSRQQSDKHQKLRHKM
jgi:hypothetical protein